MGEIKKIYKAIMDGSVTDGSNKSRKGYR